MDFWLRGVEGCGFLGRAKQTEQISWSGVQPFILLTDTVVTAETAGRRYFIKILINCGSTAVCNLPGAGYVDLVLAFMNRENRYSGAAVLRT